MPYEQAMFGPEAWSRQGYLDELADTELRHYIVAESEAARPAPAARHRRPADHRRDRPDPHRRGAAAGPAPRDRPAAGPGAGRRGPPARRQRGAAGGPRGQRAGPPAVRRARASPCSAGGAATTSRAGWTRSPCGCALRPIGSGDDVDQPLVLGIETSCDETGVGIVRGTELLADAVASSVERARPVRRGGARGGQPGAPAGDGADGAPGLRRGRRRARPTSTPSPSPPDPGWPARCWSGWPRPRRTRWRWTSRCTR